jgi:hypothetical protein
MTTEPRRDSDEVLDIALDRMIDEYIATLHGCSSKSPCPCQAPGAASTPEYIAWPEPKR